MCINIETDTERVFNFNFTISTHWLHKRASLLTLFPSSYFYQDCVSGGWLLAQHEAKASPLIFVEQTLKISSVISWSLWTKF